MQIRVTCEFYSWLVNGLNANEYQMAIPSLADCMPKVKVEPVETVEGCNHEVRALTGLLKYEFNDFIF